MVVPHERTFFVEEHRFARSRSTPSGRKKHAARPLCGTLGVGVCLRVKIMLVLLDKLLTWMSAVQDLTPRLCVQVFQLRSRSGSTRPSDNNSLLAWAGVSSRYTVSSRCLGRPALKTVPVLAIVPGIYDIFRHNKLCTYVVWSEFTIFAVCFRVRRSTANHLPGIILAGQRTNIPPSYYRTSRRRTGR